MTSTKTTVRRDQLLAALEAVEPAVTKADTVEQSASIAFRKGRIISFNDDLCIRIRGPLPEDLTGVAPGQPLLNAVRLTRKDDVEVFVKGGRLWVQAGRQRAYVRLEKEIRMDLASIERPGEWVKLHQDFLPALAMAQEFAGSDTTQFQFTCVHLTPDYLECCDCTQMLRVTVPTGVSQEILVRRNDIKPAVALGVTMFSETEAWVHFRSPARPKSDDAEASPEAVVSCRKHLYDYPSLDDYANFRGDPAKLPKELVEAAEYAGSFSKEVADDCSVHVTIEPGSLLIQGVGHSGGADQKMKLQGYKGRRLTFRVAPKLLAKIAERYTDCEVGPTKLRVDGGNWVYASVLGVPNRGEHDNNEHDTRSGNDEPPTEEELESMEIPEETTDKF